MANNRYYYYDHDTCTFVEVKRRGARFYKQMAMIASAVVLLAGGMTWMADKMVTSPEELALRAENHALQEELQRFAARVSEYSTRLEELSEADQEIYRTLLEADPISEDVRRVGVGGADAKLKETSEPKLASDSDKCAKTKPSATCVKIMLPL